jgi:hypothetical protein
MNFKLVADIIPGDVPDSITQAFLDVSNNSLQHNYKRCKITEASEHNNYCVMQ